MTAEPLRRRVRGRLLSGLTTSASVVPVPWLAKALACATRALPIGRYERLTRANLELALGAETSSNDRERIARGVRRHSARLLAEWTRLARGGGDARSFVERHVAIDGSIERLERLYRERRGVIVVTAHVGNWELLAAALRFRGLEGDVVGRTRARDSGNRWLVEMRRAYGVETLPQDAPARALIRRLASGRLLGLLCDLEVRRLDGVFAPFFGRPALTMTAPAALARAAGLPLVPVSCLAHGANYRLVVDDPLALDARLDKRAATLDLVTRMNARFEHWIRAAPEQWAWHQPRWRSEPERAPSAVAEVR